MLFSWWRFCCLAIWTRRKTAAGLRQSVRWQHLHWLFLSKTAVVMLPVGVGLCCGGSGTHGAGGEHTSSAACRFRAFPGHGIRERLFFVGVIVRDEDIHSARLNLPLASRPAGWVPWFYLYKALLGQPDGDLPLPVGDGVPRGVSYVPGNSLGEGVPPCSGGSAERGKRMVSGWVISRDTSRCRASSIRVFMASRWSRTTGQCTSIIGAIALVKSRQRLEMQRMGEPGRLCQSHKQPYDDYEKRRHIKQCVSR